MEFKTMEELRQQLSGTQFFLDREVKKERECAGKVMLTAAKLLSGWSPFDFQKVTTFEDERYVITVTIKEIKWEAKVGAKVEG